MLASFYFIKFYLREKVVRNLLPDPLLSLGNPRGHDIQKKIYISPLLESQGHSERPDFDNQNIKFHHFEQLPHSFLIWKFSTLTTPRRSICI